MFRINEEKMFFDIADGQAVIINFTTGMYYGASLLGSAVIEQLVKGAEPSAIAKEVGKAEGCPADFEGKLGDFIRMLTEKEILVEAEETGADSAEIAVSAFAEGFDLTLDEFSEVQDLLLADPVHDVDVEEGWPVLKEDK